MRLICLIPILLLAACSSQVTQTSNYLLRSSADITSGEIDADKAIAMGDILVAAYIEQPGLVLATGDGKIHTARHYQWAEPLQVSLRQFLAQEISAGIGSVVAAKQSADTRTRIDVMINQLHGDGAGAAVLVAYWQVVVGEASRSYQLSDRQALKDDGYDALAAAESTLLGRLGSAIAKSVSKQQAPDVSLH